MPQDSTYLRPGQAAERIGISGSTLAKLRLSPDSGGPSFFKVGRAVLYKVSELDAWVEARRRVATGSPSAV
jgi:predicted DNA-binding transcriptional regulator AlpA